MVKVSKKSTGPPSAPTGPAEQYRFPLYGGEPWNAIVGTVSPAKAADADLMVTVHQQLETAAAGYLTLTRQHRGRFAKGSPARLMLQAQDQLRAVLDYAEKTGNTPWKDDLEKALKTMRETTLVEGFDMLRLSRKGRTDPARNLLHHFVLRVWTDTLSETLTTGRKSNISSSGKREANSPAIRFLVAALNPLVPIRPEAAEKIVEKEKNERAAFQERRKQLAKKAAE
jgi:hypothetical protein